LINHIVFVVFFFVFLFFFSWTKFSDIQNHPEKDRILFAAE